METVEIVNPTSTRVINKLDELNRIKERISILKTDMENNVPHAEFWYKIMLNQEKIAQRAYRTALRAAGVRPERVTAPERVTPKKPYEAVKIKYVKLAKKRENEEMRQECAICFEKVLVKNSIITECNHEFCVGCFETWKTTKCAMILSNPNKIVNCPCCRAICSRVKAYKP